MVCELQMQAVCEKKLVSSLSELNVCVSPLPAACDHTTPLTSSSAGSTHIMTANGQFVFQTRHRKMIHELTQRSALLSTRNIRRRFGANIHPLTFYPLSRKLARRLSCPGKHSEQFLFSTPFVFEL